MAENYNTIAKRKGKEAQERLKEFNLSKKGTLYNKGDPKEVRLFKEKDVKEFIKILKEELSIYPKISQEIYFIIDKLAGKDLL